MAARNEIKAISERLHRPSTLIILWYIVSNILVIWDTCYIYLRPHSFAGGKWHWPFKP